MDQHDTVPGFTMQSESFYLKFVTGLQCGVSSKLLEYETDWYEVMEILLSRLQDEPEKKEQFETIASRDLEYWARIQPGGDTLNLEIQVKLEEKRYFLPPSGSRKTLRLVFNDRFKTQVLFHARKKELLRSLRDLAAVAVADRVSKEEDIETLDKEIPRTVIPDVRAAFSNCWTPRFFRSQVVACPPWCSCKTYRSRPLANFEPVIKKSTRRQLYKRVAGKAVSKKAQQKKTFPKKAEVKVNLNATNKKSIKKDSKQLNKAPKKKPNAKKQSNKSSRKSGSNLKTKPIKKQAANSSSTLVVPLDKSKKSTKSALKKKQVVKEEVGSIPKTPNSKKCDKKNTSVNKSDGKKKCDLSKLKEQVKVMMGKLKSLKNKAIKEKAVNYKEKSNNKRKAEDKVENKRKSSRLSSTKSTSITNLRANVEPKKSPEKEIVSPKSTRKSVKETPIPKSKTKPDVTKKSKTKLVDKPISKCTANTKKTKSSSEVLKIPNLRSLKRSLKNQVQDTPISKRRRQG